MSDPHLVIDSTMRSLTIPRRLMPPLLAFRAGADSPPHALVELRASGLIAAGALHPLVGKMLDTMSDPALVVSIDALHFPGRSPQLETIWRRDGDAVIGTADIRQRFNLVQVAPSLLPFHLAQATSIRPLPQPQFVGGFSLTAEALTRAQRTITDEPHRTEHDLIAAGVAPLWAERFVAALLLRRCSWTAHAVCVARSGGNRHAALAVIDAGHAGYWRMQPLGGRVEVTAIGFDALLDRLSALVAG